MTNPVNILVGDCIESMRTLPSGCVHCCVTSPPYWGLRDYGVDGQIGLESTPGEYVSRMVAVFAEVRRVMREDGTLWLNLGDSYAGSVGSGNRNGLNATTLQGSRDYGRGCSGPTQLIDAKHGLKHKDLCMIPWRVALALQADGWYPRSVIVWAKKSPMPESVTDRPTSSWEPIFLMAKSQRYFYDAEAVKEPGNPASAERYKYAFTGAKDGLARPDGGERMVPEGMKQYEGTRNQRNVWHLGPEPYAEAHFATFPTEIPRRAIMAGTSERGCCPTCGSPWQRVTSREKVRRERPNDYTKRNGEDGTGNSCANSVAGVEVRTLGWEQTCKCPPHSPVPCVVLDPFSGSGTTGAVARQLGRHYVGCELNPEYVELSRVRIGKAERPETFVDTRETEHDGLFSVAKS